MAKTKSNKSVQAAITGVAIGSFMFGAGIIPTVKRIVQDGNLGSESILSIIGLVILCISWSYYSKLKNKN
jgi:hypothetical protein